MSTLGWNEIKTRAIEFSKEWENESNEDAVPFGEEPCTKLEKNKQMYVCPYFDKCNATLMQREAMENRIIITTVAGFTSIFLLLTAPTLVCSSPIFIDLIELKSGFSS